METLILLIIAFAVGTYLDGLVKRLKEECDKRKEETKK
jgi:hypothetical protein